MTEAFKTKRTALYEQHLRSAAKMTDFAGWDLPLYFTGIVDEYQSCRSSACVFDTCHMGEFSYKGDLHSLDHSVTQKLSDLPVNRSRYGFILGEDGGVLDDLIVFRTSEEEFFIVVNALPRSGDFKLLVERTSGLLEDISDETSKIDLQGPVSRDVLKDVLGFNTELRYFTGTVFVHRGKEIFISRTGYTGELGYELYMDNSAAPEIWELLLSDKRVKPAGLGARDLLRLEMGYSLYGSDIDSLTTPFEAGLEMFVDMNKDFVGKNALKTRGLSKRKIAFRTLNRRSPRHGYDIFTGGEKSGYVTSGAFSPSLGCGIGMGYMLKDMESNILELRSSDGRIKIEAEKTELPFYKEGTALK